VADLEPVAHQLDRPTLVDALTLAITQADTQRAELAHNGDWESLAHGLIRLRTVAEQLRYLVRCVEDDVAELMPEKRVEVPGLPVFERRKGTDRKSWDSEALLSRVVRVALTDPTTGEVESDPAVVREQLVSVLSAVVPFTGSLGWRVRALRDLGIDPDEWCETSPGRVTVQFHGRVHD